tara:strand:- start:110 stop:1237 length:1128 start_codon:yes stop_codon:yes gene_type:complete
MIFHIITKIILLKSWMSYNILGITPGHNGSVALVSDGELVYYLEEERLSRMKRDGNPFKTLYFILNKYKIDEVVLCGAGYQSSKLIGLDEDLFYSIVRKFYPKVKFTNYSDSHHLTHASSAFYKSGFKEAIGITIDGNGSDFITEGQRVYETESYFFCTYPSNFTCFYKKFISYDLNIKNLNYNYEITTDITLGKQYHAVTNYLGFKEGEEGKTMGLASYGKESKNIPSISNTSISSSFKPIKDPDVILGKYIYPLENTLQNKKNLAWRVQNDTQQLVGDYIEKAIKETNLKQVCCSGGYFLNCVANYYLTKRFPDIKFYFDPVSHDGGTSMGAALYRWHEHSGDTTIRPRKTLYNGPQYSKEQLLDGIKKYVSN